MTAVVGQALEQALAFWRAPALLAAARQRPLPDDVLDVVRIAAGERAAAEAAAAALGATPAELAEAAPFYLQQLLFAPGADSYRVLGVNPDSPDARIKEHYRWLVRWLHPDRNADEWEALYADRVNRAWQDLRQPEKRAAYDASRADAAGWGGDSFGGAVGPEGPPAGATPVGGPSGPTPQAPLLSARTAQRLPYLVLGSFGLLAGAALALMWYAQTPRLPRGPKAPVAAVVEPAPAPVAPAAVAGGVEAAGVVEMAVVDERGEAAEVAPMMGGVGPEGPPAGRSALAGAPSGANFSPPPAATPQNPSPTPAPAAPIQLVASQVVPAESVAPEGAPTGVQGARERATEPPITEAEAFAVLQGFTTAYSAGDLRALMRLFTRDATNNRGGRNEIAYDYQELFDASEARELKLEPKGWLQGQHGATVLATFQARVQRQGRWLSNRSQGDIRFDLAREDGVLRIRAIRHEER